MDVSPRDACEAVRFRLLSKGPFTAGSHGTLQFTYRPTESLIPGAHLWLLYDIRQGAGVFDGIFERCVGILIVGIADDERDAAGVRRRCRLTRCRHVRRRHDEAKKDRENEPHVLP